MGETDENQGQVKRGKRETGGAVWQEAVRFPRFNFNRPSRTPGEFRFNRPAPQEIKEWRNRQEDVRIRERENIQDKQEIDAEANAIFAELDNLSNINLSGINQERAQDIRRLLQRIRTSVSRLKRQGQNAPPARTFILVVDYAQLEEITTPKPDDSDQEAMKEIQGKVKKISVHLWALIARVGTVREWSVRGDIEASLIVLKGKGGITVTFGR